MSKASLLLFTIFMLLQPGCRSQNLINIKDTKYGVFHYSDQDVQTINDLVATCDKYLPAIADELGLRINNKITIEIYPTQQAYNSNIINPDMQNSPAISGYGKIQLVSPKAEIKISGLSYEARLLFLVHEYIHILIDGLATEPPVFIDEGIACYYSSHSFYKSAAAQYVKQINFIPTISQLTECYNEIPAPDLFSFLFIDFMVQRNGNTVLPVLLTQPGFLNQDVNEQWLEFIKQNYY